MTRRIIEHGDLSLTAFSNANTLNAGGVSIRTDVGSIIGNALVGLGSVTSGTVNPSAAPTKTPAVYFNTANDTIWFWNVNAWELSGRNYQYNTSSRVTTSQVLTADDAGRCLILRPTVAGVTVELPLYSTVTAGALFDFVNTGNFPVTVLISSGSADSIVSGSSSLSALTVNALSSVRIVRPANAPWHVLFGSQLSTVFGSSGAISAGAVMGFAQSVAPTGWLKANGALISRTTYADLFAAIGTTYGAGDGSTTFAIPDLRGEFLRGWDDARGVDVGRALGSFQQATSFTDAPLDGPITSSFIDRKNSDGTDGSAAAQYISTGGLTTAFYYKVRPRNVAMLYCIKF